MEIVDVQQALGSLLFASLLVLAVFFIALRAGYFRLPVQSEQNPVTVGQTCGIFAIYLGLAFFVLPALNAGLILFFSKQGALPREWIGWVQVSSLFLVFFCLVGYCYLIKPKTRSYIFWGDRPPSRERGAKAALMGLTSLVVGYPFVFWMGVMTSLIALLVWGEAKVEQVAVKQLKMVMGMPALFAFMVFIVALLVPFMEELLFRGFLQTLLKRYLGRVWSILVTAFIFALVHFSVSQGTGNFQLISSLFVLSIFLGFVYEREKTLWAPITLHAAFNSFSIILIILLD